MGEPSCVMTWHSRLAVLFCREIYGCFPPIHQPRPGHVCASILAWTQHMNIAFQDADDERSRARQDIYFIFAQRRC